MKTRCLLIALGLGAATVAPASAELFRSPTVGGAVLGGIAGAVIGHNHHRQGWEGAAIGAAAGALVGHAVETSRDRHEHRRPWTDTGGYRHRHSGHWTVGIGYHHHDSWRHRHHGHWGPGWAWHAGWSDRGWPHRRHAARYDRRWSDPGYAGRGAFWGGVTGAIIGHNHGRRGWEGAAYGVAGGYLLGTIADARARQIAAERAAAEAWSQAAIAQPVQAAPQQVTIINNYYNAPVTPMTAANRAFGR